MKIWIIFAFLIYNISRINSIQTRIHRSFAFGDESSFFSSRHFRHIDSSDYGTRFDWEPGLREATIQALLREHFDDGNLRKHIYSAPILGKQDNASPFGDIAILARGQLYANYAGFIFVQDPYQNDCDECHNIEATDAAKERCITSHCQRWHPKNREKLMTLWTIKRIRHRSRQESPTYEVEFTISPVGLRYQNEGYLTKEGTLNYNLPGHLFVLKSSDAQRHYSEPEHNQETNPIKHGAAFIAQTPDGRKYILHSYHGLLTPDTPRYYNLPPKYPILTSTSSTTQYSADDEQNIYQTLLDVLHKKTSPESRFTPPTSLSDKTLVQFPDGQVIPITDLQPPFITKTTPGHVTVRFPEASEHKSSPKTVGVTPQSYGIIRPQTTPLTHRTTASNVATTLQQVTSRGPHTTGTAAAAAGHMTVAEPHETLNEIPRTPSVLHTRPRPFDTTPKEETYDRRPPMLGTTRGVPAATTKAPKMTFHYFAAEEAKTTVPDTFKRPLTTTQQEEYTDYENFLPDTLLPTEPTSGFILATATTGARTSTNIKETYPAISSTKQTFTTKAIDTKYKPVTVIKITDPIQEVTKSYSDIPTASTTSIMTEPNTKIIPSTALESSTSHSITTKEAHVFKTPIMVLEESSTVGSTQFQQILTVTPAPKTTYKAKYTTLQYYNPTSAVPTIISGEEEDTTLLQSTLTTTESKEPRSDTTLESTTFTKIPLLEPATGLIETTLGVTKIMGSSQNKTTEMLFYAAEETVPLKEATHSLAPTTPVRATEPTYYSFLATKTTIPTTPKRIVTTIKADGTVSVKTTPISADEELFGVTKGTTKRYKVTERPQSSTTSEPGDFLVDEGSSLDHKVPLFKKPSKDYNEDDIFGPVKNTPTNLLEKVSVSKHYTKSDLEQALFDTNNRKSKALVRRKYTSSTESAPEVVYSKFFEASTIPMTTRTHDTTTSAGIGKAQVPKEIRSFFSIAKRKRIGAVTTETVPVATTVPDGTSMDNKSERIKPVTSQSYLTSISYEVNRRNRTSDKMKSNKSLVESRYTTQMPVTSAEEDFALRLVGHAKGAEFLEQIDTTRASTLASTSAKTTTKSKYTRRSYVPKAKRPTRKKNNVKQKET